MSTASKAGIFVLKSRVSSVLSGLVFHSHSLALTKRSMYPRRGSLRLLFECHPGIASGAGGAAWLMSKLACKRPLQDLRV